MPPIDLSEGTYNQSWNDASLITDNDVWPAALGVVGYKTGDVTSATGVDPRTVLTDAGFEIDVIANQQATNTTGGVIEVDRPTGINGAIGLQGSNSSDYAALVFTLDATGRESIVFSANIRDLDAGADNAAQQVALQYRVGTSGAWTNLAYISDATTAGSATQATPLSATLPSAADDQPLIQVRVLTTNAPGNDEMVGVDDIVISSDEIVVDAPGQLSIADASITEGDAGSLALTFTVTRSAGSLGEVGATWTATLPGGVGGADAGDFTPGTVFTGTITFADGQATATIVLPVAGDMALEPNETFTVTLTDPTGGATLTDAVATGTILNNDVATALIGEIQGASLTSPFAGQTVITNGIVTAVDDNGFYLQDLGDGNAATSDAIFVFTSSAPAVNVGDGVAVRGTVTEFKPGADGLTVTELTSPIVTVNTTGNTLPAAVLIGVGGVLPPATAIDDDGLTSYDPASDGIDFWESLEGMRVTLETPQAVSNSNNFGETDVVASLGVGATGMNDRGGITIADGDFNPEKIQIDELTASSPEIPALTIGDRLGNVTGVVNYAFNNFEVLVTEAVAVTHQHVLEQEVTDLIGDTSRLTLATYNLENLDPTELSADPAIDDRFDALAEDIVLNLGAPDIIAVQEIQDADGTGNGSNLSGQATADAVIQAIVDAGGPEYVYVEIAPATAGSTGGQPGGNIRNGYFYNPDRVDYLEGSAALITDPAFNGSRKPLTATFSFNGQSFTAINVHLTSRIGSDPLWGENQPPANAGDGARTAQVGAVMAYVNDQLASDPGLEFAVMGDFNGFYFEPALEQLSAGGVFTNLATLLPAEERYSYLFEGNTQLLDNIYVTGGLLDGAAYDAVHLNSQVTVRPTDHDPQLARLYMNAAPIAGDDAVAADEDATTGNLWTTLLANDSDPGSAAALAISAVDTSATLGSVEFDADTQTLRYVADADAFDNLAPGETMTDSFAYTVTDQDGLTDTATVTVTVTGGADGVVIDGGKGADNVTGTDGEDRLLGDQGNDQVSGGAGHDILIGGQGADALDGGTGNDLLIGGQGADWLVGGDGHDGFAFGKSGGADTVLDFDPNEDRIELYDGIALAGMVQRDVNGDGVDDLVLSFTGGGGSATLLGVDASAPLAIFTTPEQPAPDFADAHYQFANAMLFPTLIEEPLF